MKYQVATKWSELTDWQLEELAYLLLSNTLSDNALQVVSILFKKEDTLKEKLRFARLVNEAPLSELVKHTGFLGKMPDLFHFPDLKEYGVEAPGDRLNNFTMKQFSVADAIFYKWRETEEELYLRQLVASLYVIDSFDLLKLPSVAERTDAVPLKKMYAIGLTYLAVRNAITERFPKVFPPSEPQKEDAPVFRKSTYTPFSKVITAMAMDEVQPLGTLKECKETNIYDFLDTLSEAILRTEKLSKSMK